MVNEKDPSAISRRILPVGMVPPEAPKPRTPEAPQPHRPAAPPPPVCRIATQCRFRLCTAKAGARALCTAKAGESARNDLHSPVFAVHSARSPTQEAQRQDRRTWGAQARPPVWVRLRPSRQPGWPFHRTKSPARGGGDLRIGFRPRRHPDGRLASQSSPPPPGGGFERDCGQISNFVRRPDPTSGSLRHTKRRSPSGYARRRRCAGLASQVANPVGQQAGHEAGMTGENRFATGPSVASASRTADQGARRGRDRSGKRPEAARR